MSLQACKLFIESVAARRKFIIEVVNNKNVWNTFDENRQILVVRWFFQQLKGRISDNSIVKLIISSWICQGWGAAWHNGRLTCSRTKLPWGSIPSIPEFFFRRKNCWCCWGLSMALLRGKWTVAWKWFMKPIMASYYNYKKLPRVGLGLRQETKIGGKEHRTFNSIHEPNGSFFERKCSWDTINS